MQHIKKVGTDCELRGVECCQKYIDDCWNQDDSQYVNLEYEASKLKDLRKILVEESPVCCYCMRKLYIEKQGEHTKNVTLEHVIPHQIKECDWTDLKEKYLSFSCLGNDKVMVCPEGKLADISTKIKGLPHPHYVSYHNLVASCNGETFNVEKGAKTKGMASNCCNNKRGNKFVLPIFFLDDVKDRFKYDQEGKLDYDDDEFDSLWFEKECLNLASDWLTSVRKFWCEISKSEDYSADDVENAIADIDTRKDILDDIDPDDTKFPGFNNDRLWTILSEYRWFYDYYKNSSKSIMEMPT